MYVHIYVHMRINVLLLFRCPVGPGCVSNKSHRDSFAAPEGPETLSPGKLARKETARLKEIARPQSCSPCLYRRGEGSEVGVVANRRCYAPRLHKLWRDTHVFPRPRKQISKLIGHPGYMCNANRSVTRLGNIQSQLPSDYRELRSRRSHD